MNSNPPFPLGEAVTRADLDANLHEILAGLRQDEPVTWVPGLNGWLVTRRDLVVRVLEDSIGFTVVDPRFAVMQVMGSNMLGADGGEHARHRGPFEPEFGMSAVRNRLAETVERTAGELTERLKPRGEAEVRRDLAAPLAVQVVRDALGLDVDVDQLLGWYDDIVVAMTRASDGSVEEDSRPEAMDHIGSAVRSVAGGRSALLTAAADELEIEAVVSNAAVVMFGGIETSETMTASAFAHILTYQDPESIAAQPDILVRAIDESLRLEPPVVQIDRFATADTEIGGVRISEGDFVMASVAGANRDPAFYSEPERFDPYRPNARAHLAFAKGPHTCIGMHLARVETRAALMAAFDAYPNLALAGQVTWSGSVFRKPNEVLVSWD
ncbi:MAG TPA: cytochrome P450 [Actinobacteria bacterium]|nr:cytochrome P450 [Actinomycetota bacterium]